MRQLAEAERGAVVELPAAFDRPSVLDGWLGGVFDCVEVESCGNKMGFPGVVASGTDETEVGAVVPGFVGAIVRIDVEVVVEGLAEDFGAVLEECGPTDATPSATRAITARRLAPTIIHFLGAPTPCFTSNNFTRDAFSARRGLLVSVRSATWKNWGGGESAR